jgi:hypothetical protein
MDIRQDPNSIPHFNDGGDRLGELQAGEPEQTQSSVELDRPDDRGDIPVGSGLDSQLDQGSSATARPQAPPPATPDARGDDASRTGDGARGGDASRTGGGAVDGLVGAP